MPLNTIVAPVWRRDIGCNPSPALVISPCRFWRTRPEVLTKDLALPIDEDGAGLESFAVQADTLDVEDDEEVRRHRIAPVRGCRGIAAHHTAGTSRTTDGRRSIRCDRRRGSTSTASRG